jgi:hypothetical protein
VTAGSLDLEVDPDLFEVKERPRRDLRVPDLDDDDDVQRWLKSAGAR